MLTVFFLCRSKEWVSYYEERICCTVQVLKNVLKKILALKGINNRTMYDTTQYGTS